MPQSPIMNNGQHLHGMENTRRIFTLTNGTESETRPRIMPNAMVATHKAPRLMPFVCKKYSISPTVLAPRHNTLRHNMIQKQLNHVAKQAEPQPQTGRLGMRNRPYGNAKWRARQYHTRHCKQKLPQKYITVCGKQSLFEHLAPNPPHRTRPVKKWRTHGLANHLAREVAARGVAAGRNGGGATALSAAADESAGADCPPSMSDLTHEP